MKELEIKKSIKSIKSIKSTEYLYGCKPEEFWNLPYGEALEFKKQSAKKLINILIEEPFETRDDERIYHIKKAISFNDELVQEKHKLIDI